MPVQVFAFLPWISYERDAAEKWREKEKRRRRKAGKYAAEGCNKEMRIFRLPFMRRQDRSLILRQAFSRSTPAETLDSRRGRRIIRNRCLFYETFYLAAQPAFQYFARLSHASFTTFPFGPSFSILTVIPSHFITSARSFPWSCVSLRLSSRERCILFKPAVLNQRSLEINVQVVATDLKKIQSSLSADIISSIKQSIFHIVTTAF